MFHTGLQFQVTVLALKPQYLLSFITCDTSWSTLRVICSWQRICYDITTIISALAGPIATWLLPTTAWAKGWGGSEEWKGAFMDRSLWTLAPWDKWSHVSCRVSSSLREVVDHPSRGGDPGASWQQPEPLWAVKWLHTQMLSRAHHGAGTAKRPPMRVSALVGKHCCFWKVWPQCCFRPV